MSQPGAIETKSGSSFARHWRGELPLRQSFWKYGVGVGLLCIIVLGGLRQERLLLTWWLSLGAILAIGIIVWQLVGIWRSARRYDGSRSWSILARVVAVICALYGILFYFMVFVEALTGEAIIGR